MYNGDKTPVQKLTHVIVMMLLFQNTWGNKICLGATPPSRPHNFLAVGAIAPIAPMESAPMMLNQQLI